MKVLREQNREKAVLKATKELNRLFKKAGREKILFLSSGGSALGLLSGIKKEYFKNNLTITVLDERYGRNKKISNFAGMAQLPFYKKAKSVGAAFIDTRPKTGESIEKMTIRFEKSLKNWVKTNPKGVVVATLGVGHDGHTAGIFPVASGPEMFNNLFEGKQKWVAGYKADIKKEKHPWRATATFTFLRSVVDYAVVFVSGQEKKKAMRRLLSKKGGLWATPARIFWEMKNVVLVTDIN